MFSMLTTPSAITTMTVTSTVNGFLTLIRSMQSPPFPIGS